MKRGFSKRGQFFLLAAVIISAVVISLGVTSNQARVNKEPKNFYDFSYDIKREAGAVIDYEIYTNFEDGANLTNFVSLVAHDIRDRDSKAEFMFIYGNNTHLVLENYGSDIAHAFGGDCAGCGVSGAGAKIINTINLGGLIITVNSSLEDFGGGGWRRVITGLSDGDPIDIEVDGSVFTFPISRYKQVIFLIRKSVEDEEFVSIE